MTGDAPGTDSSVPKPIPLLDPGVLAELEAMRRLFRPHARSAAAGAHLGRKRGGHAEFSEHRAYVAGDDLRRVDWSAFARGGAPVTKVFRAEEDVAVRLVVDTSASSAFGTPPKLEVAKRVAAAVAYLALAESERAEVSSARERLSVTAPPVRGRAGLSTVLRALDGLVASGGTRLADVVDDALLRYRRPGSLVVLSDFFDPGPWESALGRARAAGHDLSLVQVLADEEVSPPWDGDVMLVDSETGETVELTFDDDVREAYESRLRGLSSRLSHIATRLRGSYVRVVGAPHLPTIVRSLLTRKVETWAPSSS